MARGDQYPDEGGNRRSNGIELTDAEIAAVFERRMRPDESEEDYARRIFKENAPSAANQIVHIALHGENERTQLTAAQYVVERTLGTVQGDPNINGGNSPLEKFMKVFVDDVEKAANAGVPEE